MAPQAWYKIGGIQLQPAEFAKIGAVLGLSKYLGSYGVRLDSLRNYGIAFLFLFIPMGIVLAQNDTGSALVFLSLIFSVISFWITRLAFGNWSELHCFIFCAYAHF